MDQHRAHQHLQEDFQQDMARLVPNQTEFLIICNVIIMQLILINIPIKEAPFAHCLFTLYPAWRQHEVILTIT